MLHNVPVVGDPMIEHIRKTKSSLKQLIVPGMFFEDMGITYLGPIQGHSIPMLVRALKEARKIEDLCYCMSLPKGKDMNRQKNSRINSMGSDRSGRDR